MEETTPIAVDQAVLLVEESQAASVGEGTADAATIDQPQAPRPVMPTERISSLDVLRGVAVLGILLMNIDIFALPEVGMGVSEVGGRTGANFAVIAVNHVLFEGKMRTLFSMLFGAGVVLLTSRAAARGAGIEAADIYIRRNLWLLLFGIIHAYFIWEGDILFPYAIGGLILFPFRVLKPRTLLIVGLLVLATQAPKIVLFGYALGHMRQAAAEADQAQAEGKTLTKEQTEAQKRWKEMQANREPNSEKVQEAVKAYRGNYLSVFLHRAGNVFQGQTVGTAKFTIWDVLGMMLIGMALLKWGVLSGDRSERFYLTTMIVCYAIGIPIGIQSLMQMMKNNWAIESMLRSFISYDVRRLLMALGHISLIMLIIKKGWVPGLIKRLGAAGRMALTNYLMTSIICSTLFYGYGLGWYNKLQRIGLLGVVFGVWALILLWSLPWLKRYQFGPFEWLWRSLTYWKRQPMLVRVETGHGGPARNTD